MRAHQAEFRVGTMAPGARCLLERVLSVAQATALGAVAVGRLSVTGRPLSHRRLLR